MGSKSGDSAKERASSSEPGTGQSATPEKIARENTNLSRVGNWNAIRGKMREKWRELGGEELEPVVGTELGQEQVESAIKEELALAHEMAQDAGINVQRLWRISMRGRLGRGDEADVAEIRSLFEDLPDGYPGRYDAIVALSHKFKREAAAALAGPLRAHLKSMPQDTYAEKQELASWVNSQLRELGLAIRCPKTGKPATLVADVRASGDESSRFRFDVRDEDGRHTRTITSAELPELELMEAEPRREGLAGLEGKKGRTRSRGQH